MQINNKAHTTSNNNITIYKIDSQQIQIKNQQQSKHDHKNNYNNKQCIQSQQQPLKKITKIIPSINVDSAIQKQTEHILSQLHEQIQKNTMLNKLVQQLIQSLNTNTCQTNKIISKNKQQYMNSIKQLRMLACEDKQHYVKNLGIKEKEINMLMEKNDLYKKEIEKKDKQILELGVALELIFGCNHKKMSQNKIINAQSCQSSQKNNTNISPTDLKINQAINSRLKINNSITLQTFTQLCQTLHSTKLALSFKQQQLHYREQENKNFKQKINQLQHKLFLSTKQKNSIILQIQYYKQQNIQLRQCKNNKQKQQKQNINKINSGINHSINNEQDCCEKSKDYFRLYQQFKKNRKQYQLKIESILTQLEKQKEKNEQLECGIERQKQMIRWYQRLIDQTKGQFVYSQLIKQNQYKTLRQENKKLKIYINKLKNVNNRAQIQDKNSQKQTQFIQKFYHQQQKNLPNSQNLSKKSSSTSSLISQPNNKIKSLKMLQTPQSSTLLSLQSSILYQQQQNKQNKSAISNKHQYNNNILTSNSNLHQKYINVNDKKKESTTKKYKNNNNNRQGQMKKVDCFNMNISKINSCRNREINNSNDLQNGYNKQIKCYRQQTMSSKFDNIVIKSKNLKIKQVCTMPKGKFYQQSNNYTGR